MRFLGYRREDGSVGTRDHLLVLPTCVCSAHTAQRIASRFDRGVAIPFQYGCDQIGRDREITERTLAGFGTNANVGAVLVVGLGCESIYADELARRIAVAGKPVEHIVIQEIGGTVRAEQRGAEIAARLDAMLAEHRRESFDAREIILGMECGASDPTSGLASNPAIGALSDRLVSLGGTSILSETTEVIGAEHILARRFKDGAQRERFLSFVADVEARAIALGEDLRSCQPTPGNIKGGLSTIEEKSLGCMYKAGTSEFEGALEFAERPSRHGLWFMDTPGQDVDSMTGMVAGGATVMVFSTGRGTPTGCPIVPVIKITGNADTYERMRDDMDLSAAGIISGEETIEEAGGRLFDLLCEVSSGRLTRSEEHGHAEFGIYKVSATF